MVWQDIYTVACNYSAVPVHTRDKNMFCRPIKIQSFDNQTSKFTRPLWNVLAPFHKHLKGSKVNQQRFWVFCVWSFENQNEWKSCFLSGCLLNSPQKNTDSHFAMQVQTVWFRSWHFLILQHWPVIPSTKAMFQFILAEVSSSSFLLAFASSSLDFSCSFSLMNLSHGLSNLCPLAWRNITHFLTLLVFGTRYSSIWARHGDILLCKRFQIWFGTLFVTAVLTL